MTDLEDGFYWVRYAALSEWTVARHCGDSFGGLNFFIGELDSWVRGVDLQEIDPRRIEREGGE